MMLDAIVGFTRLSPISVAPPWASAAGNREQGARRQGLRVAFTRDIAGIGVDSQIEAICRKAASQLREQGATVDEIEFDLSRGAAPIRPGAASGWSASNSQTCSGWTRSAKI